MVEASNTTRIRTSAPVKAPPLQLDSRQRPFYRTAAPNAVKPVGSGRSGPRRHDARRILLRLELREQAFGRRAVREGSDSNLVPDRRTRTARHHIRRIAVCLQLTHQIVGVFPTCKAADLQRPAPMTGFARWGYGGGTRRFKRR